MKLPEGVRREPGRDGLERLVVEAPAATAEIYLHGAHVTQFQPRGLKPVLFLSGKAWFAAGKPIRGGVPLCFPWFGSRQDERPGPAHGLARLRNWELVAVEPRDNGGVEIGLRLASDAATRRDWDGDFVVDYRVKVGAALGLEFRVRNPGSRPVTIEEALHTYLAVSDVRQVAITGLANTAYLDTVGTPHREIEGVAPLRIVAETDRIYQETAATCVVDDPGWGRRLVVEKTGSAATVVWNPWIAKAQRMPDFGDDEWPAMLCIETCNVREHAVTIAPGQTHVMGAVVRVESAK